MRKLFRLLIIISAFSSVLISCGPSKPAYELSFGDNVIVKDGKPVSDNTDPFGEKGTYTDPELKIDGIREEEYDYPNGSGRILVYESENETTYVSLYKGERAIYFIFECEDDYLSTLNVEDINLVTAQSDSVEIYVDTYGAGGKSRNALQYEFRVTASERIYSYLTGFVARVFTYGTLDFHTDIDEGFNVEGYISYSVLGDDVNKDTPTSFAFARVTKTGNRGFEWHGAVDPQVPDNYLILHKDNKMYKLDEYPVSGSITGRIVNLKKEPVSGVKVAIPGIKTAYTNANGQYTLQVEDLYEDIKIDISKTNYLSKSIDIARRDIRLASNRILTLDDSIFIANDESSYQTTIKGKITERDGTTPISGAEIELNGNKTVTDSNGNYTLMADCYGYVNYINYSHENHITYRKEIEVQNINISGITEMPIINLDENNGDQVGFGHSSVGLATARAVRNEDSFKLVLKTPVNMDVSDYSSTNFEVFIDTKTSASFNKRDNTDYLFTFAYAEESVQDLINYGGKAVNSNGINTTYGRINELYFVEVDIPYEKIGVTKDEVFGLYFGIKSNWQWAGMYDNNGNYIIAEAPIHYVRLGPESRFFIGSCNTIPSPELTYNKIATVGQYPGDKITVQYDVSYAREADYVMLKFDLIDNGVGILDQMHSINVYLDMNCTPDKNSRDKNSYHISLYPGKPVSRYNGFDEIANKESSKAVYEEDVTETWTYLYDKTIYVKISTSIFGGNAGNPIGFTVWLWNDEIGSNSKLTIGNRVADFENPSTYFIVSADGNINF